MIPVKASLQSVSGASIDVSGHLGLQYFARAAVRDEANADDPRHASLTEAVEPGKPPQSPTLILNEPQGPA
jgi:hypothetical protein